MTDLNLIMTDEERIEIMGILHEAVMEGQPIYNSPTPKEVVGRLKKAGYIITTWRVAIAAGLANA